MFRSIILSKSRKSAGPHLPVNAGNSRLDPADRLIVAALQRDGRQSNAKIARRLGLAESTVRRRIDRLIREGLIQVVAVAEPLKVGYTIYAQVGLQIQPGKTPSVAKRLKEFPEVTWLAIVAGQYDLFLSGVFEGPSELLRFTTVSLGNIPGIERTETFYILDMVKRAFDWRLPGSVPARRGREAVKSKRS